MDRQDIDALLIGALYGELTAADEARLATHLESHPGDRGALDDLKSARQAVRESRIFELQWDPPQAVSALLLQEAHRRAPKRVVHRDEKEGWFARFTRVFIAHPAMAAAATLVLVVGVAGTLYVKKGDHFADQRAESPSVATQPAQGSAMMTPTADLAASNTSSDAGVMVGAAPAAEPTSEGYRVGLDDQKPVADGKKKESASDRWRSDTAQRQQKLAKQDKIEEKKAVTRGIAVGTKGAMPKDLPEEASKNDSLGFAGDVTSGRTPGGAAGTAAPPPPPAIATTPKPAKAAEAQTTTGASNDLVWAKQTHDRAVKAATSGDCELAAKYALQVLGRAPDYYNSTMHGDRKLKGCQWKIAAERDKDAEQRNKSRASKRVNADDAYEAPASPSK